jgi:hypothetical protein
MSPSFFNIEKIEKFPFEEFQKRQPYPWVDFDQFLTPEGFKTLHDEFPPLELFEYHENIQRGYGGQRPHNRYYLAYEQSIYHKETTTEAGVVHKNDLSPNWQRFMEEIESGPLYRPFIQRALGVAKFNIRYAWHIGKTANEVSPHSDATNKVGTHIFYFNTSEDWEEGWGGQLLVLEGRTVATLAPDFKDFTKSTVVSNINNHSFLFKNVREGWHGVKRLHCPEGYYRKLFNVIFMYE